MEDGVSDINDENNERNYKGTEAECLDDTFSDEMREGVNDKNENKNEKYDEEKEDGKTTDSDSTTIDEFKGVMNERGEKDIDLD